MTDGHGLLTEEAYSLLYEMGLIDEPERGYLMDDYYDAQALRFALKCLDKLLRG